MCGKHRRDFLRKSGAIAAGGAALLAGCLGDEEYPARDIRNIIPWDAGGGSDAAGRGFVDVLEDHIGTDIYTENISGAVSGQGMSELMNAEPDGYTIGTATWDSYVTVEGQELIEGYDFNNDLRPLNTFTEQPCVFCVHEDSEIESMSGLIDYAEDNPGELDVSTAGEHGITHMPAIQLEQEAGIEFNYVHYEGGGGQSEALGSGETEAGTPTLGLLDPVMDSVRILGVTLDEEYQGLEDVPLVVDETGYEIFWNSTRHITVPADTDEERVEVIAEACNQVAEDEEWQEFIDDLEGSYTWLDEEETNELIEETQDLSFDLYDDLGV